MEINGNFHQQFPQHKRARTQAVPASTSINLAGHQLPRPLQDNSFGFLHALDLVPLFRVSKSSNAWLKQFVRTTHELHCEPRENSANQEKYVLLQFARLAANLHKIPSFVSKFPLAFHDIARCNYLSLHHFAYDETTAPIPQQSPYAAPWHFLSNLPFCTNLRSISLAGFGRFQSVGQQNLFTTAMTRVAEHCTKLTRLALVRGFPPAVTQILLQHGKFQLETADVPVIGPEIKELVNQPLLKHIRLAIYGPLHAALAVLCDVIPKLQELRTLSISARGASQTIEQTSTTLHWRMPNTLEGLRLDYQNHQRSGQLLFSSFGHVHDAPNLQGLVALVSASSFLVALENSPKMVGLFSDAVAPGTDCSRVLDHLAFDSLLNRGCGADMKRLSIKDSLVLQPISVRSMTANWRSLHELAICVPSSTNPAIVASLLLGLPELKYLTVTLHDMQEDAIESKSPSPPVEAKQIIELPKLHTLALSLITDKLLKNFSFPTLKNLQVTSAPNEIDVSAIITVCPNVQSFSVHDCKNARFSNKFESPLNIANVWFKSNPRFRTQALGNFTDRLQSCDNLIIKDCGIGDAVFGKLATCPATFKQVTVEFLQPQIPRNATRFPLVALINRHPAGLKLTVRQLTQSVVTFLRHTFRNRLLLGSRHGGLVLDLAWH